MATSIPPHNLGEIINGTLALIENKDIKIKELMKHIPGPDFPTGGVLLVKILLNKVIIMEEVLLKLEVKLILRNLKNGRDRLGNYIYSISS